MLITLDSQWTAPAWEGIKVLALLPDTAPPAETGSPRKAADRADDWRLFHFTRPRSALAIIQTVLDRLDRHRQFAPDPLIFAAQAMDDADCTAEAARLSADPWRLDLATEPDSRAIRHLVIGHGFTGHRMFLHYFRSLNYIDGLNPSDVVAQLDHYLGPKAT